MHVCYIFYYSRRSGPKHEREGLSLGVCIVNVLLHLQADGRTLANIVEISVVLVDFSDRIKLYYI